MILGCGNSFTACIVFGSGFIQFCARRARRRRRSNEAQEENNQISRKRSRRQSLKSHYCASLSYLHARERQREIVYVKYSANITRAASVESTFPLLTVIISNIIVIVIIDAIIITVTVIVIIVLVAIIITILVVVITTIVAIVIIIIIIVIVITVVIMIIIDIIIVIVIIGRGQKLLGAIDLGRMRRSRAADMRVTVR